MGLWENVRELIQDHPKDGATEQALITTLYQCIEDKSPGGGGASGGSSSPLSLKALDILRDMEQKLRYFRDVPLHDKSIEERLIIWYNHSHPSERETLERETGRWCEQIRNLTTRRFDLIGKCPNCGAEEIREKDESGKGTVKKTALTRVESEFIADCRACGKHYEGIPDFEYLAKTI